MYSWWLVSSARDREKNSVTMAWKKIWFFLSYVKIWPWAEPPRSPRTDFPCLPSSASPACALCVVLCAVQRMPCHLQGCRALLWALPPPHRGYCLGQNSETHNGVWSMWPWLWVPLCSVSIWRSHFWIRRGEMVSWNYSFYMINYARVEGPPWWFGVPSYF